MSKNASYERSLNVPEDSVGGGQFKGETHESPVSHTLSIIVPVLNEEETVPIFYDAIKELFLSRESEVKYEIIFIDDGSLDRTLEIIKAFRAKDSRIHYLSFARNFGKEAALFAGLSYARGEYIACMDVDMQDPPSLLLEMFEFLLGDASYDVAVARRADRRGEKRFTSFLSDNFYRVMSGLSSIKVERGARDFRVMRRCVRDAVLSLRERNRFSKGIFQWVGFKTKWFSFTNKRRVAGKTKWSIRKLFSYSLDGIESFSTKPLHFASILGITTTFISIVFTCFIVIRTLIFGDKVSGWPSLASIILFIGGLELFSLGIIGQYIGKIFLEVKDRPLFIIREKSDDFDTENSEDLGDNSGTETHRNQTKDS